MNTKKATKRALLTSVMALVMCVVMLVGTTFAWFTDTASTGVNKIQAGNLDVELQMKDSGGNWVKAEGETLNWVKAEGHENEQILWEPGCTYELPELRIVNKGNLALKYKISISGAKDATPENDKNDLKLLDVIDWTYNVSGVGGNTTTELGTERHLAAKTADANEDVFDTLTIKGQMQTSAGNDYQGMAIEGIAITVVATQDTVENDSLDNTYDQDAEYPILVTTGDELQAIVSNATAPVNIVLTNSITTNNFVIPEGKDVTLDLNGFTLTGGDSHAILNRGTLCIKDSSGNGKIVASKANTSALRNAAVCVIEGGTFTRAVGENNKWHTVENFGTMTFNGGKVIAEDGQSFAIVNGWNYIDPGEQKATMTINNIEMKAGPNGLKNCAGGTLTMNGGTLHCTGYWGLSNDSTGVATINGGEITSDGYVAISDGGAKMEINGGTFTGPQGSLYVQNYAKDTVVKGGSYQNETVEFMQKCCAPGYTAKSENGVVVVSKN